MLRDLYNELPQIEMKILQKLQTYMNEIIQNGIVV